MIEKLGHKKTLQRLRNQWIEDSKPKPSVENDSDPEHLSATPAIPGSELAPADASKGDSNFSPDTNISPGSDAEDTEKQGVWAQTNGEKDSDFTAGIPNDDELDHLMAHDTPDRNSFTAAPVSRDLSNRKDDAFADDEDMMREMDVW
jgi:replication fork protection complex subunit Csm3/Swi3